MRKASPEQQKVLDTWGQGLAVTAGAGSGKTTTLVMKCSELLRRDPGARFAAVSFTERSASDLRLRLSEELSLDGQWVMTIHGLCGAVIREFPREAGYDGEERMLAEPEAALLWERATGTLWSDDLPAPVAAAFEELLSRESQDSVFSLLLRVRELAAYGALDSLLTSPDTHSRALAGVASFVLERYDRLKRRQGALDFSDLERGADRALEHSAVREAFHKRFDLVLVDEFQDTNPLQARIVSRFARSDRSNLCVVGDPKQSIYRFRDADVSVFEDFCSKLPVRVSLTWNFRSRPGVIDYANRVCEKIFPSSGLPFEALVPMREKAPSGEPVLRLSVTSPSELAAWILGENEKGIPLQDMAILLRRIRGNERWLKALTSAGIPIAVGSGGLFWEDPRIRELFALLQWWDHPPHSLAGAVFLRAPWVGVSDAELDRWIREDPTLVEPFFRSGHRGAEWLGSLRGQPVRPGELLLALLQDELIERELGSSVLGLWHRVEELSLRGLDFHAVVVELSRAVKEGRREKDVPPPHQQGQLTALTLHSSKGLEFPHVILLDFGPKRREPPAPLLFWDREKGAFLSPRDEDGERDGDESVEAFWRELEKKKNAAESKRLLYVALTRAQERTVLVCPELPERKDPAKGPKDDDPEKVFARDDWRSWIDRAGIDLPEERAEERAEEKPVKKSEDKIPRPVSPPSERVQWVRPRHSVTEWNLLSACPRAYEWTHIRPRREIRAEGESDFGLSRGGTLSQADIGSEVHACLENRDEEGLRKLERKAGPGRFRAEPLIRWARESGWMSPRDIEQGREVWTELAFEVALDPGAAGGGPEILVGSMDRVIAERGGYTLLDFKVSAKPKAEAELLGSYRAQMELYAEALAILEPGSRGRTRAFLVNISPERVDSHEVPLGKVSAMELASLASRIVQGEPGTPWPGSACRYCDHRALCPEAASVP